MGLSVLHPGKSHNELFTLVSSLPNLWTKAAKGEAEKVRDTFRVLSRGRKDLNTYNLYTTDA